MAKKKGKSSKNNQTVGELHDDKFKKAPHSIVINRGHVGKNVTDLIMNMRRVMSPYTASRLKARRKNVLKDYVSIAGALNVSHLITFSKTESSTNMRVARLPRGPTLTFKVSSYTLCRDVISSLKHHRMEPKQFNHHPLLVLNNFTGEGMHFKLITSMFQNLFPSININEVKLGDIRRCVLLNYNQETDTVDFRHYNIKVVPMGMSKSVKKIVKAQIPNMGRYNDVSEFVLKGNLSESEAEPDGPDNEVILPQAIGGRGNVKSSQSAIRLTEIGPRLTLQLVKIEAEVCTGEVLYHKFIEKTPEEIQATTNMRQAKRKLKIQRKTEQEKRVKLKDEMKEEMKRKSLKGMEKNTDDVDVETETTADVEEVYKDDIDYFREEVGAEPDPELFPTSGRPMKRKQSNDFRSPKKKMKFQQDQAKVLSKKSKGTGKINKTGKDYVKGGKKIKKRDSYESMDWAEQKNREKNKRPQTANFRRSKTASKSSKDSRTFKTKGKSSKRRKT